VKQATGSLALRPLPELLIQLRRKKFTGLLELTLGKRRHFSTLWIKEGRLVQLDQEGNVAEPIGQLLTRSYGISKTAIEQANRRADATPGLSIDQCLVEMGLGQGTDIGQVTERVLQNQVERMLDFHLRPTDFALTEGLDRPFSVAGADLALPVALWVLRGGDKDRDDEQVLAVGAVELLPNLSQDVLKNRLKLRTNDLMILHLLDRPRLTAQLLDVPDDLPNQKRDRLAALIRCMVLMGFLRPVPAKLARALVPVELRRLREASKPPETAPVEPDPLDSKERHIIGRVDHLLNVDFFALFEVARDAPAAEVANAYVELAQRWHPDRLTSKRKEVIDAVTRLFARINDGRDLLVSAKDRDRYIAHLDSHRSETRQHGRLTVQLDPDASKLETMKGQVFLRKKQYNSARLHLKRAQQLDPENETAERLLVLAVLRAPETTKDDLVIALDAALTKYPEDPDILFESGAQAHRLGNEEAAKVIFKRVLKLRPHHREAERFLRLFELRAKQREEAAPNPAKTTTNFFARFRSNKPK
jgi:tetratricopeptide (TPR) repeat protein